MEGEDVRKGSFQDLIRNNNVKGKAGFLSPRKNGTRTMTAMDFNDSYIVGCGMDGKVHVWEPKPSVVGATG